MSVANLYEGWARANLRARDRIADLDAAALALKGDPDGWPIWAVAAHIAGARVYWLCGVLGEPGAASTPFPSASGYGWEDEPGTARSADELVWAIDSSWTIVEDCLDRWAPADLEQAFNRPAATGVQRHTRASVLARLLAHDHYHWGAISALLGLNGLAPLDPWRLPA